MRTIVILYAYLIVYVIRPGVLDVLDMFIPFTLPLRALYTTCNLHRNVLPFEIRTLQVSCTHIGLDSFTESYQESQWLDVRTEIQLATGLAGKPELTVDVSSQVHMFLFHERGRPVRVRASEQWVFVP